MTTKEMLLGARTALNGLRRAAESGSVVALGWLDGMRLAGDDPDALLREIDLRLERERQWEKECERLKSIDLL